MDELSLVEFQKFNKNIDINIYKYISIKNSILRKKTNMSTNPSKLKQAIKKAKNYLKK